MEIKSIINNKYFSIKDIKYLPEIIFWGLWLAVVLITLIISIKNWFNL